MNNQKGFTLIELVVVIVILGILAAVAVPKFVDMQNEAKKAAVEGARGSVKSAVGLVHAKWLAAGEPAGPIDVEGGSVTIGDFGYPTADAAGIMIAAGLTEDFEINSGIITRTDDYSTTAGDKYWGFEYTAAQNSTTPPDVGDVSETTVPEP